MEKGVQLQKIDPTPWLRIPNDIYFMPQIAMFL